MTRETYDVAVIGGGLMGLASALFLARKGQRVVVLERAWVGRHASGATAGGVRTLNRDFAEVPLGVEAIRLWRDFPELLGDDCGFQPCGQIRVAEAPEHMTQIEERVAALARMGYTHEKIIDAKELRKQIPFMAPHCVGATLVPDDGAADPHQTLAAFRRAVLASGVTLHECAGVREIHRRSSRWELDATRIRVEAGWIVNAAGAWAAGVAHRIGDDIPLGSRAPMMVVTERVDLDFRPVVGSAGRSLSFKRTSQGTLVIGGGVQGRCDVEAERSEVDFCALKRLAETVTELFPGVGPVHITRCWTGIEGETRDHIPVIDFSPNADQVVHVLGFSGHGFLLVPAVGAAVADLILHGETKRPIAPFRLARLWE